MPNTGTLTGLAPATEHVLDAVHVDAHGNVSAVASSVPFTTAPGAASVTTFLARTSGYSAWTAAHVFNAGNLPGLPTALGGTKLVLTAITRDTGDLPLSVVAGGAAAALRQSDTGWMNVGIYDVVAGASGGDIVVTLPAAEYCQVAVYATTGAYLGGANSGASGPAPLTHDLSLDTAAGQAVIGGCGSNDLAGLTFTGLAQRGTTVALGARQKAFFDTLAVAGGAPEAFAVTLTGGTTRYDNSALALYG